MIVSLEIHHSGSPVAEIKYKPGFFVEVEVRKSFRNKNIAYRVTHQHHDQLIGNWSEALDKYFNEWTFESRSDLFTDEPIRVGCAREHRTLFIAAARALEKDLTPHGYKLEVSFE